MRFHRTTRSWRLGRVPRAWAAVVAAGFGLGTVGAASGRTHAFEDAHGVGFSNGCGGEVATTDGFLVGGASLGVGDFSTEDRVARHRNRVSLSYEDGTRIPVAISPWGVDWAVRPAEPLLPGRRVVLRVRGQGRCEAIVAGAARPAPAWGGGLGAWRGITGWTVLVEPPEGDGPFWLDAWAVTTVGGERRVEARPVSESPFPEERDDLFQFGLPPDVSTPMPVELRFRVRNRSFQFSEVCFDVRLHLGTQGPAYAVPLNPVDVVPTPEDGGLRIGSSPARSCPRLPGEPQPGPSGGGS